MSRVVVNRVNGTDLYFELVREYPLRPIRTKCKSRLAMRREDRRAVRAEGSLERGEQDYLDTLSLLIEEYDRAHRPAGLKKLNGLDVLRHLMEENEMSVSALGKVFGSKGVASEILS